MASRVSCVCLFVVFVILIFSNEQGGLLIRVCCGSFWWASSEGLHNTLFLSPAQANKSV